MGEDWVFDKMPNVPSPPERIMFSGPDAMRPDKGLGGKGQAFIFFPDGHLEWAKGIGHETMIDFQKNENEFMNMISHAFSPEEIKKLSQDSTYRNEPFFETDVIRSRLQSRALFGRLGSVAGHEMLSFWPGTNNFLELLSNLINKLLLQKRITTDTVISIGKDAVYTVGQFLEKKKVGQKLNQASNSLGKIAKPSKLRQMDVNLAAKGIKPFGYTARYGESFRDFYNKLS